MSVIAPRTTRMSPTSDRVTSGPTSGMRIDGSPKLPRRLAARRRLATSDLHDDREDHRPALGLVVQVAGHAILDLALEQRDLADVIARVLDRGDDPRDGLGHHRVLLVEVDEPAGDDL